MLIAHKTISSLVDGCKQTLINIMCKYEVILCCVPGLSNVDGNEIAEVLAR